MASRGERLERTRRESPQDFIEKLRRVKFKIGTGAASTLAPDLHRTIKQLSVELYQNDFHFIKEIVQNAEDNTYAEDVSPSLEFQLIKEDLAEVGASATLVILNNEVGLRTEDVVALCSAGHSTKIGKRNEGLIGCKGIGFKSVFMICETPMIISNGYRIRFRAVPTEEAGVGYIVPEWIESPSNEKILSAIGHNELASTVTILPIKNTKVELVQKQLKEISPEILLFLTRIRELNVVDKTKPIVDSVDSLRITRSEPVSGIKSNDCKFSEVTLSVGSPGGTISGTFHYFVFEKTYPVTQEEKERKEIRDWTVVLAFPKNGRPSSRQVGDVFSFLPTELRTGFPFIVNADFLLTTSRESIRFDSPWNIGILDCIPAAFELSFMIMAGVRLPQDTARIAGVQMRWDSRDAYKFLPHNTVSNAYRYSSAGDKEGREVRQKVSVEAKEAASLHQIDKIRTKIFEKLEEKHIVRQCNLCVSDCNTVPRTHCYVRSARHSVRIMSRFHDILKNAAEKHRQSPALLPMRTTNSIIPRKRFGIVDEYVQKNYALGLAALGVSEMTAIQYTSFLRDSEWLLSLPEDLYFQLLTFFACEPTMSEGSMAARELKDIKCLKFRGDSGKVQLGSFSEFSELELVYTRFERAADWIFAWAKEFEAWYPIKVMPLATAMALVDAKNSNQLIAWINRHGTLTELSIQKYAEKLIEKLVVPRPKNNPVDRSLSILILQFLYSGIRKGLLSSSRVIHALRSRGHVCVVQHLGWTTRTISLKLKDEGGVVLPRSASKWPLLFSVFMQDEFPHVTELSDEYLVPQCSQVKDVVTRSNGADSFLNFLKEVFNAVDIPHVKLPASADLPFCHPVTMEKSLLLWQWLKVFLPSRRSTKAEREDDRLLSSLKALKWVKTCHHGWRSPNSVFLPISHFENHFSAQDLPLLDVSAYSVDLNDSASQVVFEELGVATDMRKGCAVAQYFFSCTAEELDQVAVERFYSYLNEVAWEADEDEWKMGQSERVWIPASGTRSQPRWRAPSECMICDEHDVFKDCDDVSILSKIYDKSLLSFFSDKLRVPDNAFVQLYCKTWLKWTSVVKEQPFLPHRLSLATVKHVWSKILEDWRECDREQWESFCSSAWVPVAPLSAGELNGETISIVSPNQALIADDLALSQSFNDVVDRNLNFAWVLPDLSARQEESLVNLYAQIGVPKLSSLVTSKLSFPANVLKTPVPWGKGLICEGLLRCVLAYLCKKGIPDKRRGQILAGLVAATEIVVSEPFEVHSILDVETLTSPATIIKRVLSHYDTQKKQVFYLKADHALVEEEVEKRAFNSDLVNMFSRGILSKRPKLVGGLANLLKLLWDLKFATKFVEYELQAQHLSIRPEDEKLLMEKIAKRQKRKKKPRLL